MPEIIQSILLGIIQGLTEFLPVSSSGHLEIFKAFFGEQYTPESSLLQTVVLHFATALSTVYIFRKDILRIIMGALRSNGQESRQYIGWIILSMVPAALVGVFAEEAIESLFGGKLLWVGIALIVTALLLYFSDRSSVTDKPLRWFPVIVIGLAQAIAIIPGISRSGATIASALLLGIKRAEAARFSFLMVIPLIFGKMAKDVLDGEWHNLSFDWVTLIAGFIAAFIVGAVACTWMINWVKQSKLSYFALYCVLVGTIVVVWSLLQ